jgi:ABC-type nitrate/sulfonate/bicarbonate transport system substrate-binding protein
MTMTRQQRNGCSGPRVFLLLLFNVSRRRLRIAWSGSSPAHTPIWVVEEKNLLKKYGIDGEIISITASSIAVQVLLAGEVDVIIGSVANLTSRLAGADTVMILARSHFCGSSDHLPRSPR